ncbi:MAG: hypothetical protein K9M99_02350 [Candidatus Cloacimonetes bacterium]|nr:hypothetical protein [Candidatus Cloacimonadota bacterium]
MKKYAVIVCIFVYVSLVFSQVTEEVNTDSIISHLTNPELYSMEEVKDYAVDQYLNMLYLVIADTMNIAEEVITTAAFFQSFIKNEDQRSEFLIIDDKLCLKLPKSGSDFRKRIINLIRKCYEKVSSRWRRLGLEIPDGLYFIWVIRDFETMKEDFETEEYTMAFAIPCRYLVVPYNLFSRKFLSQKEWEGTYDTAYEMYSIHKFKIHIMHELTHTFVNSLIGYTYHDSLSTWFHEATAIWLSGDDGKDLTREYKVYMNTFNYIQLRYGNRKLRNFIHDSIIAKNTETAFEKHLGVSNVKEFEEDMRKWKQRKKFWLHVALIGCAGLIFILIFIHLYTEYKINYGLSGLIVALIWFLYLGKYSIIAHWFDPEMLNSIFNFLPWLAVIMIGLYIVIMVIYAIHLRYRGQKFHSLTDHAQLLQADIYSATDCYWARQNFERSQEFKSTLKMIRAKKQMDQAFASITKAFRDLEENKRIYCEKVIELFTKEKNEIAELCTLSREIESNDIKLQHLLGKPDDKIKTIGKLLTEEKYIEAKEQLNELIEIHNALEDRYKYCQSVLSKYAYFKEELTISEKYLTEMGINDARLIALVAELHEEFDDLTESLDSFFDKSVDDSIIELKYILRKIQQRKKDIEQIKSDYSQRVKLLNEIARYSEDIENNQQEIIDILEMMRGFLRKIETAIEEGDYDAAEDALEKYDEMFKVNQLLSDRDFDDEDN